MDPLLQSAFLHRIRLSHLHLKQDAHTNTALLSVSLFEVYLTEVIPELIESTVTLCRLVIISVKC